MKDKDYQTAKALKRSSENAYRFLDSGNSISKFQENYRINKTSCGQKLNKLPEAEIKYTKQKVVG